MDTNKQKARSLASMTVYIKTCTVAQDNHNRYMTVTQPRSIVVQEEGRMFQIDLLNDLRVPLSKGDTITIEMRHDVREKKLFSTGLVLLMKQNELNLNSHFSSLADYLMKNEEISKRVFNSPASFGKAVAYLKDRFERTYGKLMTYKDGGDWVTVITEEQEKRLMKTVNDHYVLKRFGNQMDAGQADLIHIDDVFGEEALNLHHTPLRTYFLDRLAKYRLVRPVDVIVFHLIVNKFEFLYDSTAEVTRQRLADKLIKRYNMLDVRSAFSRFLASPELFLHLSNDGVAYLRDIQRLPVLAKEGFLVRTQALIIRSEKKRKTRCCHISSLDPRISNSDANLEALKRYDIYPETINDEIYYSFDKVRVAEETVVKDLLTRQPWHKNLINNYKDQLDKVVSGKYIKEIVDEEQMNVLKRITELPHNVILGPGGCGKTTLIKYIIAAAILRKDPILCVSFTGKAVQRVREVILDLISNQSIKAIILHNFPDMLDQLDVASKAKDFLKAMKDEGFLRVSTIHSYIHSIDRTMYQITIIDEISMISTSLYAKLLPKLSKECKVVMLGDSYQLPPVKNYSILAELLRSDLSGESVGFFYLSKVYRSTGPICSFLTLLRSSWNPNTVVTQEDLASLPWSQDTLEGITVDYNDEYKTSKGLENIVNAYCTYRQMGISTKVLCFTNAIVDMLNVIIQATVNPVGDSFVCKRRRWSKTDGAYKLEEVIYRVGDPVICTKNSSSHDLYNGQEGVIRTINLETMEATVSFYASPNASEEEQHTVTFYLPTSAAEEDTIDDESEYLEKMLPITVLRISYALTTHKCQGSQYGAVIYYVTHMDTRNLLYTGCGRSERHLYLYVNCAGERLWDSLLRVIGNKRTKAIRQYIGDRIGIKTVSQPQPSTPSSKSSNKALTASLEDDALPDDLINDDDEALDDLAMSLSGMSIGSSTHHTQTESSDLLDQLLEQYMEYE